MRLSQVETCLLFTHDTTPTSGNYQGTNMLAHKAKSLFFSKPCLALHLLILQLLVASIRY